jgi:hypothetical protein
MSVVQEAYWRRSRVSARARGGSAIERKNVPLVLPTLRLLFGPDCRAISNCCGDRSTVRQSIATPPGRGICRLRRHEANLQCLAISRAVFDGGHKARAPRRRIGAFEGETVSVRTYIRGPEPVRRGHPTNDPIPQKGRPRHSRQSRAFCGASTIRHDSRGSTLAISQPHRQGCARASTFIALQHNASCRNHGAARWRYCSANGPPVSMVSKRPSSRCACCDESLGVHLQIKYRLAQSQKRRRFGWPRRRILFPQRDRAASLRYEARTPEHCSLGAGKSIMSPRESENIPASPTKSTILLRRAADHRELNSSREAVGPDGMFGVMKRPGDIRQNRSPLGALTRAFGIAGKRRRLSANH